MADFPIQNNPVAKRFEAIVDGHLAKLDYEIQDGTFRIDYVYVPAKSRGRGVGGALVEAAVAWAKQEGLKPYPLCGFARTYLNEHPELEG